MAEVVRVLHTRFLIYLVLPVLRHVMQDSLETELVVGPLMVQLLPILFLASALFRPNGLLLVVILLLHHLP